MAVGVCVYVSGCVSASVSLSVCVSVCGSGTVCVRLTVQAFTVVLGEHREGLWLTLSNSKVKTNKMGYSGVC